MGKTNLKTVPADDRYAMRSEVRLSAVVDAGAGRRYAVTVVNVSANGVMAELDAAFVPGRPVAIEIQPLGRLTGQIAWVRDGHAGIAFSKPLTFAQLDAVC